MLPTGDTTIVFGEDFDQKVNQILTRLTPIDQLLEWLATVVHEEIAESVPLVLMVDGRMIEGVLVSDTRMWNALLASGLRP